MTKTVFLLLVNEFEGFITRWGDPEYTSERATSAHTLAQVITLVANQTYDTLPHIIEHSIPSEEQYKYNMPDPLGIKTPESQINFGHYMMFVMTLMSALGQLNHNITLPEYQGLSKICAEFVLMHGVVLRSRGFAKFKNVLLMSRRVRKITNLLMAQVSYSIYLSQS